MCDCIMFGSNWTEFSVLNLRDLISVFYGQNPFQATLLSQENKTDL